MTSDKKKMTNRFVAGVWVAAIGLFCVASVCLAADKTPIKSKPDVVIYEGTYPGWPWITAGADGTLYCVFRDGTEHGFSAAGRAMITKSSDRGKTWSPATVIVDEPGVDDRNVAIVELPNRELLVTYNTYARINNKMVSQVMSIRSADGGKTWGTPQVGPVPNSQSKSAAVVLQDGSIIWPFYIAPKNGAIAAISKDLGKTWTTVRIPESPDFTGDEWDLVEKAPGHLLAIMRNANHSKPAALCFSESRDGGLTWSTPKSTNLTTGMFAPGQIFLQGANKTPTVIYPDRRMVSVSAAKTDDPAYLKWNVDSRLPCYLYNADQSRIPDGSYAVSVPTGPNQRLVVDYEIRPNSKRIAGYFVDFPADW